MSHEEVEMSDEELEVEEDTSLANSDVTTKYQEAAKIANAVMTEVAALCVAGASIFETCKIGDAKIEEKLSQIYRKKGKDGRVVEKGIAFPVCLSVNDIVCHFSPCDNEAPVLSEGDLVKIDLGVHVDGFIAVAAHTLVVGGGAATGNRARVLKAAYLAAEAAVRLIKPGNTNTMVTQAIKNIADAYGVNPISGTLMHQMKRYVIDANKVIALREEPSQRLEECTFEPNEVYAVDVAMSTGEGRPRDRGIKTTVYKRLVDRKYGLKVNASRVFLNEVNRRFPALPFTLRAIEDEKSMRMGLRECVTHELLLPYQVLTEREGDQVAHFKFTVLLLPGGTTKVTGLQLSADVEDAPVTPLSEELVALLATEEAGQKKRNKKAGKKKADESA